jgi:hypothetical protein
VPLCNNVFVTSQAYNYNVFYFIKLFCLQLFALTLRDNVGLYIFISVLLSSRKRLLFSHWLIPKSCDGPHKNVSRATCGPRVAGC